MKTFNNSADTIVLFTVVMYFISAQFFSSSSVDMFDFNEFHHNEEDLLISNF